jgi:predicted N-acetyltransferase YhbS
MITIEKALLEDAPAILALQKSAFQTEAVLYNDDTIPPLTQTLESLAEEIRNLDVLKAVENGQIIGSVRANVESGTCFINRLMVHPLHRQQGLGTRLMQTIEKRFPSAKRYQLGTGHLSMGNLRLYQSLGYRELRREPLNAKVLFVILEKGSGYQATTP